MNEARNILAEQVDRLLGDAVTREERAAAEAGAWPGELWRAVEEAGLPGVLAQEGAGWAEAEVVCRAAGRHQVPLPLVESVLACWLLSGAGIEVPSGPLSVAPVRPGEALRLTREGATWRLDGTASRVPWARDVGHLAVLAEHDGAPHVALVGQGAWSLVEDTNIAGEPRDTCAFEGAEALAVAPASGDGGALLAHGALARAAQIAGALEFALDQSVRYANDRVQFGRPIGKFQAVQQELARFAGEVAAAGAAAELGFQAAGRGDCAFEAAVAKCRASEAATTGAAIAHQTFGALGFTHEHALHFATRRLWSWRAEMGSETHWAEQIGRAAAGRGGAALWPDLTARGA
jgi:alkylation response protein AidB-like acyl-CoA dehydrogenase